MMVRILMSTTMHMEVIGQTYHFSISTLVWICRDNAVAISIETRGLVVVPEKEHQLLDFKPCVWACHVPLVGPWRILACLWKRRITSAEPSFPCELDTWTPEWAHWMAPFPSFHYSGNFSFSKLLKATSVLQVPWGRRVFGYNCQDHFQSQYSKILVLPESCLYQIMWW